MAKKHPVRLVGLLLLLALAVAAITLFLLANHTPSDYRPVAIAPGEKKQKIAALEDKILRELIGPAGEISSRSDGQPIDPTKSLTIVIKQDELNEWVGSLPEEAVAWLANFGLRDPAVALGRNRITFYIYWAKFKKVLGIDLQPVVESDGMLRINLQSVRMGNLPMPQSWVDAQIKGLIQEMQVRLQKDNQQGKQEFAGLPAKKFRKAAWSLLEAASGVPVNPSIRESWGNVRLSRFGMEDGQTSIELVPIVPGEGGLINMLSAPKGLD